MGCVNTSSKEFKQLILRHNVDNNALELIIHNYWAEKGLEDVFPSDAYIQAQLGNTQYKESNRSVRELWKKKYNQVQEFETLKQVQIAQKNALKYFPESSVVFYKTASGKYALKVKKPVLKINKDNIQSFNTLDLKLDSTATYSIDKVEELFGRFNTDRRSRILAAKVFGIAKRLNIQVSFSEALPWNTVGRSYNNNSITYKKSFLENDWLNEKKASILLHEVIHSLTMYALSDQTADWKRPEAIENFKNEISDIFNRVRYNSSLKDELGVSSVAEFVAELGNPLFVQKLQAIDNKSIWQKIKDVILSLFGIKALDSYYTRSLNALNDALDAFDLDTYIRYNSAKANFEHHYAEAKKQVQSNNIAEIKQSIAVSIVKDLNTQDYVEVKSKNTSLTFAEKESLKKLKPEYRGKLIYAQSGTGKTSIADNIGIIDGDYLLGQVLGVSTETAGFFFAQLSRKQKKVFGEKYRDLIKQEVSKGKTVLTANVSLANDASVIVYNQTIEQTQERTNRDTRAITNRVSSLAYLEANFETIKNIQANDKTKEYIVLDDSHYIGDFIISTNYTSNSDKNTDSSQNNGPRPGLVEKEFIYNFLNEFGISIHHLNEYDGDLPLFDALNRVINIKSKEDITDGVGYAIAFMMQADPKVQKIIINRHGFDGTYKTKIKDPRTLFRTKVSVEHASRLLVFKNKIIKDLGASIAKELKSQFDANSNSKENKSFLVSIINSFFVLLRNSIIAKGNVVKAYKYNKQAAQNKEYLVRDIIEALGRNDFTRIKGPKIKPNTSELAQQVSIATALKENPFEENIIYKLSSKGIALGGSASIALEGTLYRPTENPLHDIDFNGGNNSNKKSIDAVLDSIFPSGTWQHSTQIKDITRPKYSTETYIVLNTPFELKNVKNAGFYAELYSLSGEYLGKRIGSELELVDGVQGKLLDFFVGPNVAKYGASTKNLNGKDYLISSSNAAMAAKILWARPKDMWDYKNFSRNDYNTEVLLAQLDFLYGISDEQFKNYVTNIELEWADYNLFEDAEQNAGKGKTFTFNDGMSVRVPFTPNKQQADALNAMDEFIKSDESTMTLSGYAGTGKTSLMEMLASKMRKQGRRIIFTASTNQAAGVLKSRVSKLGYQAYTLNKAFGIAVEVDTKKEYDAKNLVNVLKESTIIVPGDVIVIDEASMINETNYEILNTIAKELKLKIIYAGDEAQLAPVKETKVSKVFRNNDGKVIRLTQVERTGDNAILKEATNLRNNQPLSGESQFNTKGEGVAYVSSQDKKSVSEIIRHYVEGLKDNPNFFRILAFTNAAVATYNRIVRDTLGYNSPIPHVGEPMTGYTNWGYDYYNDTYLLVNSASYNVTGVHKPIILQEVINGRNIQLEATPISLENSEGNIKTFNFIDIKSNPTNRANVTFIAKYKSELWNKSRTLKGHAKADILKEINYLDSLLFVNDEVKEGNRTVVSKVIDFGYAVTIHKSQGSTYNHVLVDDVDVSIAANNQRPSNSNFSVVDIEETPAMDFGIISMDNEEFIDLGDLGTTEPTSTEDTIDLQQQLRYVAVSRATNTVSIISNPDDIVVEGSPLNPTNTVKTQIKGENISSKGSEFAKKLTNVGNNLGITFRGKQFRNSEHAYQTWKSGEFDEVAFNSDAVKPKGSKPVNKDVNYQIMVEILTAKLQQYPELVEGITQRGGVEYLKASTHNVIGDSYWESGEGKQNKFIEALTEAYNKIKYYTGIPNNYDGIITPGADTIFVFGSNPEGRHGKGAAKVAKEQFGAIYGQGEGLQGNSYALPTKDLRVKENKGLRSIPKEQIVENIKKMYATALAHPDKQFKVAYTHDLNKVSLNGYTGAEMIQMFKDAGPIPSNIVFSKNWTDHWDEVPSVAEKESQNTTLTENTLNTLRNWYKFASKHITFNKDTHTYYIDGNPIDISATGYAEKVFGKKDIKGDYSHSMAIGNTMDAIYRDFFEKGLAKVQSTNYPNINDQRKQQIIQDLNRFKAYLDKRFEGQYKAITTEFPIAAYIEGKMSVETIAGAVDMMVIDKDGNIHIFDFKAKNHPITKTYNGKEVDDRRDYTAQQNIYKAILESVSPELKGKVKSLQLVWMDTTYPSLSQAKYNTDKNGNITINTGNGDIALSESTHFSTPSLKDNIEESIIPLEITNQVNELNIPKMSQMDTVAQQLVSHLKEQGIEVLGRKEIEEYIKKNGLDDVQEATSKQSINSELSKQEKEDIRTLLKKINHTGTTLLNNGEGTMYLLDHADREDIENRNPKTQDGFNCRLKFSIEGYTTKEINKLKTEIENGNIRDQKSFDKWAKSNINQQRRDISNSIDAEDRRTNGSNDNLDLSASKRESFGRQNYQNSSENSGKDFVRIPTNDGNNGSRYALIDTSNIQKYQTSNGELYGFVDKEGRIHLDETVITSEHPIHEFTHLWDRVIAEKNPELWARGVELLKNPNLKLKGHTKSIWKEIEEDANYGQKWQHLKESDPSKYEFLVASEVHALLTGKSGKRAIDNITATEGQKNIVEKVKQWINDVWKSLKETFSEWTDEDLESLSIQDFCNMSVRDFFDGNFLQKAEEFNLIKSVNSVEGNSLALPNFSNKTGIEVPNKVESWKVKRLKKLDTLLEIAVYLTEQEHIIDEMKKVLNAVAEVSLPSYEYYNELQEYTIVDAEWKVSILQALDKQLNNASPEEQSDIMGQINSVIAASSQEDLERPRTKQEKLMQQNLNEYEKINNQINNLLNSDLITATEVRHVAELIMNYISDVITDVQSGSVKPSELFSGYSSKLDISKATRKEIVQAVGINNLIAKTKEHFDSLVGSYEDDTLMDQADLILDNWEAMMLLAADTFAANEGFGIRKDYNNFNFDVAEGSNVDWDNFNSSEDIDATEEEEGDSQERWQVESRTIDVLSSMSDLVRKSIRECYRLDKNGNTIISKWGIKERVDARQAVNSILRWTQGSLDLEDMITKLSNKKEQNPWLTQLTDKLSDTSGKYSDLQSQFFGVIYKHFQAYSIVVKEDGLYHSIPVNSPTAIKEAVASIEAAFNSGTYVLVNKNKVNSKWLGTKDAVGKNDPFTLHKALFILTNIQSSIAKGDSLGDKDTADVSATVTGVCKILGYNVTEELVSNIVTEEAVKSFTDALNFIVVHLENAKKELAKDDKFKYDPFAFNGKHSIGGALRNFLQPITEQLEDKMVNAFYDSGKLYQSYITPSYLTKLMTKFKLEGDKFDDFIINEYGSSEWFVQSKIYDLKRGVQWKSVWLKKLATDPESKKIFDHKVELNFNGHNYMRNMSDAEYTVSLLTEYFAETTDIGKNVPAWYRIPMQSNKPSSEFIKFWSYREPNYKQDIIAGVYQMYCQELSRIQTVVKRNRKETDPDYIKNFDSNGKKFNFLPFLNKYLDDNNSLLSDEENKASKLLKDTIKGTKLSTEQEADLMQFVKKAIQQHLEKRTISIINEWRDSGLIEAVKKIKGIYPKNTKEEDIDAYVESQVENFIWNDYFASKNILQLTISDIAFYKDAEDLQKRLAQLHAPGIKPNVLARDYNGQRVSDGKYRTMILEDFESYKSNIIANITEVFDRKIARASADERPQLEALKECLVGKDGKFQTINITDAQGYSSPTSYRKKAFMFGKWSAHAENIYQKLLKGDYNYTDLEVAFQPLKPFVYTQLHKNIGTGDSPISTVKVPFQAKNAEYLLIMADAIIKGEEKAHGKLSRPNILRAIYDAMEDSAYDEITVGSKGNKVRKGYNGKGIDTVQFTSAIKSGLQGAIDLNQFLDKEDGESQAYSHIIKNIYKDVNTKEYNVDSHVHVTSFEDYCLQQEVPAHFANHTQAHGSQIRAIIPSDLSFYKDPNGDLNDPDNIVYYEWTEPDGTKKKLNAKEFKKEYEETIAANIENSIRTLSEELCLYVEDKRVRNIALSKVLQREILSSPRYGINLMQACSVDKETGEFRIPKGDPIQAKRIEQLVNSIIKNRINKQKIAGGPVVQVSSFGTSKQLHIRFKHKKGGILKTEEEYNNFKKEDSKSYKEYVAENQAGVAYFEVYVPIWSKDLVKYFSDKDGNIDIKAIEIICPELLDMISYRIPTEDKYSIAPTKAVGFMPREAGDAIMFPHELTGIDDSDFDVDKRYIMRKDIKITPKDANNYIESLEEAAEYLYVRYFGVEAQEGYCHRLVQEMIKNPQKIDKSTPFRNSLYETYLKHAFDVNIPTQGKEYRDNKIIDMTLAVLTNEATADQILNPGGFDDIKKVGYMIAAFKNPANRYSWEALKTKDIKQLKKLSYVDKDLTWIDTQIQFYRQNSAATSLIGVFAVNKVAHAILEGDEIVLNAEEVCIEDQSFSVAGIKFSATTNVDSTLNANGEYIGRILGSLTAASADAVKDPVLNLMNINRTTAGILNTLLRLGMPFEEAALFMSQSSIENIIKNFNKENLSGYVSLDSLITARIEELKKGYVLSGDTSINTRELTKEELIEGLSSVVDPSIEYKTLINFQKVGNLTAAMRNITFSTRFNSIASAVGPLIIDNLIIERKKDNFTKKDQETGFYTKDGKSVDIYTVFDNHPILEQFAATTNIARILLGDMPSYSRGFSNVLNALPTELQDKIYNDKKLLDKLSMFYQSYVLVASGFVDSTNLKYFVEDFPTEFIEGNYKEKYPNNAFIQSINLGKNKKENNPNLGVKITGIDETIKEQLMNGWIDLHKDNPELSTKLFLYNFFRGGIGFNPRTFMSLVPTYVKENLVVKRDGKLIKYTDVYRKLPATDPHIIIDQFISNNWNDYKLVSLKGDKKNKYQVDLKSGTLIVGDDLDVLDLAGVEYMKTNINNSMYLWKRQPVEASFLIYRCIPVLGNNGEYLEISTSTIKTPIVNTTQDVSSIQDTGIRKQSAGEDAAINAGSIKTYSDKEVSDGIRNFLVGIKTQREIAKYPVDDAGAWKIFEDIKKNPKFSRKFIVNVFKQLGVEVNESQAVEKFNEYC